MSTVSAGRTRDLRLLSLTTGEVTTLVAGERHISDLAWSPDGGELAYVVRRTPELGSREEENRIEHVSVASGEPHIVARMPRAIESLVWTANGASLLFISSVSPYDQASQAVYCVPAYMTPEGDEPAPPRLRGAELRRRPFNSHTAPHARSSARRAGWIRICTGSTLRRARASRSSPPDAQPDADIQAWSVTALPDGGCAVAMILSSDQDPPEVWMARLDTFGSLPGPAKVSFHQEPLAGVQFARQEPFYWTAPDGLALDGLLIRPPQSQSDGAGPLPMIVLVHGGPYGRNSKALHLTWTRWGQWLALAGYAVLLPNYRGGQGHGEAFAAAARGAVGKEDFGDVMSAVDAAIERGIADPERLGIGGWSQGGFMAAWAVTQTTRFKAAVMGAGVSDWGMMVATSDLPIFEGELGGSAPWDGIGPHRHAELSPISFARNVKTPVLILHGEEDARVPVSQAILFHRALREVGALCSLVTYPREPHAFAERAHQIDVLTRVRAWYDRWLRP